MSEVKSYRFDEEMIANYEILKNYMPDFDDKRLLKTCLRLAADKVQSTDSHDVVVDFSPNLGGIKSDIVKDFINEVNSKTNFNFDMYLDGNKVVFNLE